MRRVEGEEVRGWRVRRVEGEEVRGVEGEGG